MPDFAHEIRLASSFLVKMLIEYPQFVIIKNPQTSISEKRLSEPMKFANRIAIKKTLWTLCSNFE